MKYLTSFVIAVITVYIILMPAWISWLPKATWPITMKRIIMIMMGVISSIYTLIVVTKPNIHINARIIGSSIAILYLVIVFVTIYYTWTKLR